MEQCLGEHKRDWSRCQQKLGAFRICYAEFVVRKFQERTEVQRKGVLSIRGTDRA